MRSQQETANRHDYAVKPYGRTALNILKEQGYDVISVGARDFQGLCFVNLVDFDALWGHRRNPEGYGKELEAFDRKLGELLSCMREDDLLLITADHGNDPTYTGTDHTREMAPLLAYSPSMEGSGRLETAESFGVIGYTAADNFEVRMPKDTIGSSLLERFR